jgi:hypothetical protein
MYGPELAFKDKGSVFSQAHPRNSGMKDALGFYTFSSKLDPYKATIAELLEKDPSASAYVIGRRLQPLGYTGGGSVLRQYATDALRPSTSNRACLPGGSV